MPNLFNNLLSNLSTKLKGAGVHLQKDLEESAKTNPYAAGVKELTSQLRLVGKQTFAPTFKEVESIANKKSDEQVSIIFKGKTEIPKIDTTKQWGKYGETAFQSPGSKSLFSGGSSKIGKEEAMEFVRSGKAQQEIDEIRKEWIMEETKIRTIYQNPNLTFDEVAGTPFFEKIAADAYGKWDQLWEKDRDKLVPSLETVAEESLIKENEFKEEWMKEKLTDEIKGPATSKGTLKKLSLADLATNFPEWYAAAEKEYYQTKSASAYMGLAIKSVDQDIVSLYGEDKVKEMEINQALLGGGDPKTTLTAMTLDIINFEDIANIGQDVYVKGDKIYYRGFEVAGEYINDEARQVAMATDLVARFTGSVAPYAGISSALKKGVFAVARAKDVPRLFKGAQKLAQGITWASKNAPVLAELTAFNTFEEITEALIRKGTGQEYTFSDFVAGLMMGAGMAGGLSIAGKTFDTVALKGVVRKMEANVRDSGHIHSLKDFEFGGQRLFDAFEHTRYAYLKGLNKPGGRPGIDYPAKIEKVQDVDKKGASPVQQQMQLFDTNGKTKVGETARKMEALAVEKGLTKGFDLKQQSVKNLKDEFAAVDSFISKDYQGAVDIAMGKKTAPEGLNAVSFLKQLEEKALQEGDVKTLRDLATKSALHDEAIKESGQTLRILREREPNSPVTKMREVVKAREEAVKKKTKGRSPEKVKSKMKSQIKKRISKPKIVKPKTWTALIDELTC